MSGEPADTSAALLLWTVAGFAAVSWLLWRCLLNPLAPAPSSPPAAAAAARTSSAAAASSGGAARTSRGGTAARAGAPKKAPGGDGDAFSFGRPRRPPHLVPPVGWEQERGGGRGAAADLSMCVVQGVVPFRSTPAAGYEAGLKREAEAKAAADAGAADGDGAAPPTPPDPIVVHRRERARIFARMFATASGGGRPPNRGANVVAAIRHSELSCPKLQKALFLLGTYYNLFVLVDSAGASALAGGGEGEMREFVRRMRSELLNRGSDGSDAKEEYRLNAEVLPPHRIAFSSTPKGRVAFARQLHGTELVLDFDGDVTKELERFGFRVLAYPKNDGSSSSSSLGDFLIPGPFCSG